MAVYRHNEKKNKHYSNKDIDRTKSQLPKAEEIELHIKDIEEIEEQQTWMVRYCIVF